MIDADELTEVGELSLPKKTRCIELCLFSRKCGIDLI